MRPSLNFNFSGSGWVGRSVSCRSGPGRFTALEELRVGRAGTRTDKSTSHRHSCMSARGLGTAYFRQMADAVADSLPVAPPTLVGAGVSARVDVCLSTFLVWRFYPNLPHGAGYGLHAYFPCKRQSRTNAEPCVMYTYVCDDVVKRSTTLQIARSARQPAVPRRRREPSLPPFGCGAGPLGRRVAVRRARGETTPAAPLCRWLPR